MTGINHERMKAIVRKFNKKRILVLGDLMMDKYIWGDVSRISPEAPIPVVEVRKDTSCLGGAGNVSQNLLSLGAFPIHVGLVGRDKEGEWLKNNLPCDKGIFVLSDRPTTIKTRIIAHHQQVVRVDKEDKRPIPPQLEEKILAFIQKENFDGLLISDYNKGLIISSLLKRTLSFAQQKKIPVYVDPKVSNFFLFSPVSLITPNHHEAEKIVHHECNSRRGVEKAGEKMLEKLSAQFLIIKRGEQGLSVFERGKKPLHIPTIAKEVYDVTGAGDTVIATASLALLSDASIQEAAILANTAAGIVVGKLGTASLTPEELLQALPS